MKLYHSRMVLFMALLVFSLIGCQVQREAQGKITIEIVADGGKKQVQLSPGSTVQEALKTAGVEIGALDRSEPPFNSVLSSDASVQFIRVKEELVVQQVTIPFEHQVLQNESMTEGEQRLVQPGVNGLQEITYRNLLEDGKQVSSNPVKTVVLTEATPEIVMVGRQAPFAAFPIPGRLVYLMGGNAWVIDGNTSNRRPIITTGDLDGRIFSLSPDGAWLLFTRRSKNTDTINSLWAVKVDSGSQNLLVDLKVNNVIQYAGWRPGLYYIIAYSTVEPRAAAPGWQANNDLNFISLSNAGQTRPASVQLETNMGGKYGWWGMSFAWAPDGLRMGYARPDSVGLYNLKESSLTSIMDLVTLQTRGDWAWVPGLAWGPDGKVLFSVDHVPPAGASSPEESTAFDLTAISLDGGQVVHLVSQAGMFAYPLPSPIQKLSTGESAYQVAYLQAISPNQSETSRTYISLVDRDGSNRHRLFPQEGAPGLDPQSQWGAWSPSPLEDTHNFALAVIYQNNLWLVDAISGSPRQLTGDGTVSRMDWK